jgi:putative transposase
MIDCTDPLLGAKQATLLGISRSGVYYLPRPLSSLDQGVMVRVGQLNIDFPFSCARMLLGLPLQ